MPKILIIDDEPDLRLALSAMLDDHGYDVAVGADGSEALELAIEHRPDAIILDINMQVVDGITALKILKADARTSEIPVCMLTAIKDPSNEQYAREIGADEFFGKPWSEDHLVKRLAEIIALNDPGSGGEMTADSFTLNGPYSLSADCSRLERDGWLSDVVQARLNVWAP